MCNSTTTAHPDEMTHPSTNILDKLKSIGIKSQYRMVVHSKSIYSTKIVSFVTENAFHPDISKISTVVDVRDKNYIAKMCNDSNEYNYCLSFNIEKDMQTRQYYDFFDESSSKCRVRIIEDIKEPSCHMVPITEIANVAKNLDLEDLWNTFIKTSHNFKVKLLYLRLCTVYSPNQIGKFNPLKEYRFCMDVHLLKFLIYEMDIFLSTYKKEKFNQTEEIKATELEFKYYRFLVFLKHILRELVKPLGNVEPIEPIYTLPSIHFCVQRTELNNGQVFYLNLDPNPNEVAREKFTSQSFLSTINSQFLKKIESLTPPQSEKTSPTLSAFHHCDTDHDSDSDIEYDDDDFNMDCNS